MNKIAFFVLVMALSGCGSTTKSDTSLVGLNKNVTIAVPNSRSEDFVFYKSDARSKIINRLNMTSSRLEYLKNSAKEDARSKLTEYLKRFDDQIKLTANSNSGANSNLDQELERGLKDITDKSHSLFSHSTYITHYDNVNNMWRMDLDWDKQNPNVGKAKLVFIKQWKSELNIKENMGSPGVAVAELNIRKMTNEQETTYQIELVNVTLDGPKVNLIQPIASVEFDAHGLMRLLGNMTLNVGIDKPATPYDEIIRDANQLVDNVMAVWVVKEKEKITLFRKELKVGDVSHCGMVVQIRDNIAEVQRSKSVVWEKIDLLYPSGTTRRCHI